jgi:dihydrofolate synthase/folylpolyglutamate synthase
MPASVLERAAVLQCPTAIAGRDFHFEMTTAGRWTFRDSLGALTDLPAPTLAGAIQYRNAATALAAARRLQAAHGSRSLQEAAVVVRGLAAARLPGRFQVVAGPVEWIIDVAHNPAAATELALSLQARAPARRTLAVFGMLSDKDIAAVTAVMDPYIDEWLLCDTDGERGLQATLLHARMGVVRGTQRLCGTVAEACACARALAVTGARVVVFGSFHVAGPALDALGL